jgi:hypothetical protein
VIEFLQRNIFWLSMIAALAVGYAVRWRAGIPWYCNILPCETMQSVASGNVKTLRLGFLSVIGICLLPVLSVGLAGIIASSLGCQLDEGDIRPCIFCGLDIGGILYVMAVSGWLLIASLPLAAITSVLWIIFEMIRLVIRYI